MKVANSPKIDLANKNAKAITRYSTRVSRRLPTPLGNLFDKPEMPDGPGTHSPRRGKVQVNALGFFLPSAPCSSDL